MARRIAKNALLVLLMSLLVACAPQATPQSDTGPENESAATEAPAPEGPEVAVPTFRDCADCPELVAIPAGSFTMGSPDSEVDRQEDEGPQHKVTLAKSFAVGAYEVTTGEYARFMAATRRDDYDWKNRDQAIAEKDAQRYPVGWISWQDAKDYAAWLSQTTGKPYRLLSEAEWEYVARAGTTDPRESPKLRSGQAKPVQEEAHHTFPVGSLTPNAFGVYDLTGNMPEWIEDCYRQSYAGAPTDGSAVEGDCRQRVVRGTINGYDYLFKPFRRVANRDWGYAVDPKLRGHTGFRIARDLP
jgi:formylglycine-generating enzyme required for sulfatase activity